MTRLAERLARMDGREIRHRVAEAARVSVEAVRFAAGAERWRPRRLGRRLQTNFPVLSAAAEALRDGRMRDAETTLRAHFRDRAPRFPLAPSERESIAAAIGRAFPSASDDARRRGERLLERRYDLLGYADLSFRTERADTDWHFDPVHGRRAPSWFWRRVPFLDPRYGDHKIIWELNRHQHWLALGRAAWLTGDASYAAAIARELREWMEANPPLTGVNWASMLELAFRSMSWLWALHFLVAVDLDPVPDDREPGWLTLLLCGLDRQLDHVARHLSTYFSPNTHLLGEALALYACGRVLPELKEADRWAEAGRAVLCREARHQILPDGGHAERSAHYHRYALDFYLFALIVARWTEDPVAETFADTASRMATYCRWMADDRGRLPLIGDDDGGALFRICGREVADATDSLALAAVLLDRPDLAAGPPPEEVLWLSGGSLPARAGLWRPDAAPSSPRASRLFPDTGYAVLRVEGVHAIVDVGPHGFLNGGHAHADALALVVTLGGMPLLIDPGTATYTMDRSARDRFRSARMHNTLVLDGRGPSEPDGPFHWRTRADARVDCWRHAPASAFVEGSHQGYAPVRHVRAVLASGGLLIVADHLMGDGEHRADLYWHFDPRWELKDGTLVASGESDAAAAIVSTAATIQAYRGDAGGLGWCSPVYGQVMPALTLCCTETLRAPATIFTAVAGVGARHGQAIAALPVEGDPAGWHRAAARLAIGTREAIVMFATPVAGVPRGRARHRVLVGDRHFETDARAALLEFSADERPAGVTLVDGRAARWTGAAPFAIEAPAPAADLHLDLRERRLSRAESV